MKRNIRSGTVYTNQGGAAQARSHSKASCPVVGRAVEDPAPLGTGKAQPTRVRAQNASASAKYLIVRGQGSLRRFGTSGITRHRLRCLYAIAENQAGETAGLNVDLRYALLVRPTLMRCSRPLTVPSLGDLKGKQCPTLGLSLDLEDTAPKGTFTMWMVPINARVDQAQVAGASTTDAATIIGEGHVPAAGNEDVDLLRLCDGIGYVASTMVLEA